MGEVRIVRLEQTNEGALGSLVLYDHLFCTTLEPDNADPIRNQIPVGVYKCERYKSPKFGLTFQIIVPGHTFVEFHPGNREVDTVMCVLLGQYPAKLKGERAVINSGSTFKKFMAILSGVNEFEVEFIDFYPQARSGA